MSVETELARLKNISDYHNVDDEEKHTTIKLYRRRWAIIAIYAVLSGASSLQWMQYSIIANIIMKYYGVTSVAVDWTSMITMITYPPLIVPATYLIDKIGLRYCMLLGVIGTAIGTWIKVFSTEPNLFWVGFVGQTVVFVSQVFIFGLPPKVAGIWFGPDEISTACAIGVTGSQFGAALGFILPPLIVKNHDNLDEIGKDLAVLFYGTAIFITLIIPLIFFFFKDEPECPPSKAQAQLRSNKVDFTIVEFWKSYKSLLTNKPFLVQTFCFGMNIAIFAAICTLLNQMILAYFKNAEQDTGTMGLLMLVIGLGGVMLSGVVLDKTKKFKETTIILYVLTILGILLFIVALETHSKILVFVSTCLLGFFQNGYFPVGIEFAVELSFPQPESSTTGILISMAQIFGVIFTLLLGEIMARFGTFWALSSTICFLLLGCVITVFIPNILRRQEALGVTPEKKKFLPKYQTDN